MKVNIVPIQLRLDIGFGDLLNHYLDKKRGKSKITIEITLYIVNC